MVIFNSRFTVFLRVLFVLQIVLISSSIHAAPQIWTVSTPAELVYAMGNGKSGDVVKANNGTYPVVGDLSFGTKAMTLESVSGNPADVVIQGTDTSNSTFYITAGDSVGSIIRDITIIGARGTSNGDGGAMNIQAMIRVENCIIRDSSASKGGGVHISNAAKPTFKNCRFINNASSNGGAVYLDGEAGPSFSNCLFVGNNRASGNGDVMYLNSSAATLTNCTITGNANDDSTIYQYSSYIPLIITNCIIDAAGGEAVESVTSILGTEPPPYYVNTYINGGYDDRGDQLVMLYEPNQVRTTKTVTLDYPNAYVSTEAFAVGFTSDYHLGMASSCIGIGGGGSGSDMDGEARPYYLSGKSDIGADQFNFCYLVEKGLETGNWFDVSLPAGTMQVANDQATGSWVQTGKIRYYRIIPQVSGVLRIWSDGATVDVKGVLTEDCTGDELLASDDNSAGGVNFRMNYVYAEQGRTYYLGVINKGGTAGTYDLFAQMETDTIGNSCSTATSSIGTFGQRYFETGYTDRAATGAVDFTDDEDAFKIAFTVPGTLMITSRSGTSPSDIHAVLKDAGCNVVSENSGSDSIVILYNNKSADECYLIVKRSPYNTSESSIDYGFDVRYYPLDDRVSDVYSAISPENWEDGGVATSGSLVSSSPFTGDFTIKGNGIDIASDTFDEFYYAGKAVAGDFVLTAKVEEITQASGAALSDEAKAGAMIRETLDKGAKCAFSGMTAANGYKFSYRAESEAEGVDGAGTNTASVNPEWVRIKREHNTVLSYYSNDGATWYGYGNAGAGQAGVFNKTYDSLNQVMNNKTYAMLGVTSNDPRRDIVNIAGHENYSYRCKQDHTSTAATKPRDLVVSVSYSAYGLGTKYYICQKDHIALDAFVEKDLEPADNKPRLGNVKVGTKDFQCRIPHTSTEASRPRAYHYVFHDLDGWAITPRYYKCVANNVNKTPRSALGDQNTDLWDTITEAEYNAVSEDDKQEWNSATYYGPAAATDWPEYWQVVGSAGASDDAWAIGRQYSSAWKEYWRLDRDATSCDCGSLSEAACPTYTCAWAAGTAYGVSWLDFWSIMGYTLTEGTYVTNWADATVYETGQYALARFTNVNLDTRDIVFLGGLGTESGQITYPGDTDVFEFDIDSYGTITVTTDSCDESEKSKINVYNFLGEKIMDNGATIAGTGNYQITQALVTTAANSSELTAVPFTVSPGKYYLRVSALGGHTNPFEYGLNVNFTPVADDHGDYRQTSTILRKWSDVLAEAPLLYFRKEQGLIASADDVDYFRVDLPYRVTLKAMADLAASSGAVGLELLDGNGNVLVTQADVRAANPHYLQPAASIPEWSSALTYIVNEIVRSGGSYYRCIQTATGQALSNGAYWQILSSAPPVDNSNIVSKVLNPGTYYIRVTGAVGLSYLLAVDIDDFGNDVANASEAKDNYEFNSFEGHFETARSSAFQWGYDADAFKLVVPSRRTYTIYTTGDSDTYGNLQDSGNVVKIADNNSGEGNNFSYTITLEPGTYYIVMCMENTYQAGDYVLHIDQTDDYSDTYTGTPMGALSSNPSGLIEDPGDIDYFTFVAASSSRVKVTFTGNIDLMMELTSSTDKHLTHSSSGVLEFDVTAGYRYYLSVKPLFAMNTGNYSLSYELQTVSNRDNDGGSGTSGNDYETARSLTLAGTPVAAASYMDGGVDVQNDYDYYYFDVTGPGVIRVYTTGTTDTYGYLFLNEGGMYNLVMSNDDSDYDKTDGYNFGLDYYVGSAPGVVKRFYVKVRGYAPHETGDYQLYIRFTSGVDDHGDECEAATPVNRETSGTFWESGHTRFGSSMIGITGDRDYFRFVAGPEGTDPGSVSLYSAGTDVDTFGYLKNDMCGTIAFNDNGSGAGDGDNFRIAHTPDCTVGVDCIPKTYYGVVRSYNGYQTGSYDLHVVSNGASVEPVSNTTMAITAGGVRYFGFDTPDEVTFLSANVAGEGGFVTSGLRATLYNGKGEVISGLANVAFPITAEGLDRSIHYIKVTNTGGTGGDFTLNLNCGNIGSVNLGSGSGSLTTNDTELSITGEGASITGTSDNGYFVFTRGTGSCEFIAKVTFATFGANTQAGLTIREGLGSNGKHLTSMVARNAANTAWEKLTRYRTTAGGATTTTTNLASAANGYYVRLHYDRSTHKFTTGYSADGITWTSAAAITLTLNDPVYAGFVYASGTDGTIGTVTFTNIHYTEIADEEE